MEQFSRGYNEFIHHSEALNQNRWVSRRHSVKPLWIIVCYRKTGWNLWSFLCKKSDNIIIMASSKCINVLIYPSKIWTNINSGLKFYFCFVVFSGLRINIMFVTLIQAAFKHHHFLGYNHSDTKYGEVYTFCLVAVSVTGNL